MSPSPTERDPGGGRAAEAIAVDTSVREERGRWAVDIVVVFADEAVQRTVNTYRTRRHAEIAARWIRRAAERDVGTPIADERLGGGPISGGGTDG